MAVSMTPLPLILSLSKDALPSRHFIEIANPRIEYGGALTKRVHVRARSL